MPFTNSPQYSTYKTVKITFDNTPTLRSALNTVRRDSHIINFFYDRVSQENKERDTSIKKRPGIVATTQSLNKVNASDVIRGYYYEEQEGIFFWAVGNKVYKYIPSPAGTYTSLVATLATSSGEVGFEVFQKSTGATYILFSDGTNLWSQQLRTYPDTAAASVSDTDLPSGHLPKFVVLDGYVFIAKGNTIYNSDVDTFDTWTSGNDIDCEMSADNIRLIFQNKNYLVAMGYNSTEIFWDAGNASGSPLSRNDSGFKSIGYISGYNKEGDRHYFVGQDSRSNVAVYRMENFKVDKISNEVVNRSIQATNTGFTTNAPAASAKATMLSVDGHTFYCLYTTEITWVFDVEEHMWYEWRSSGGVFSPEAAWSSFDGMQYIANNSSTTIDILSPIVYNDKGTNFTCSYTTEDSLFNTVNWKTANRVSVVGDRYQTTGSSLLTIQWSDDDWANGPTGSADVNMFLNLPKTHRCGRFRNRSFRLLYTDNYPIRLKYLELEINTGAH